MIAAATFLLYLVTLTRTPTSDSLVTVLAIERTDPAGLLIPHRLLIQPLGWAFVRGWEALGWGGGALLPLQVFSALGGAVSAALIAAITRRLTGSTGAALLTAIGFAASGGAWWFSTDAEPVMQPLALALVPIWGLLAAGPAPSRWHTMLLGLATTLAMLTYMTSAILLPVLVIGLSLAGRPGWPERWRRLGLFAGVVLVTFAPIYLLTMATAFSVRDAQAAQGWRLYGGRSEVSEAYGRFTWANLPYGAYGFVRSLVCYPQPRPDESTAVYLAGATGPERAVFVGYLGAGLAATLAPLAAIATRIVRRCPVVHRQGWAMLATWGVLNAVFACWWVPGDPQFWIPTLSAWWLLVGVVLAAPRRADATGQTAGSTPDRPVSRWSVAVAGILVAASMTGLGFIAPGLDAGNDRRYVVVAALRDVTSPDDVVVTNGLNGFPLYLAYFAPRRFIDVYEALRAAAGRESREVLAEIDRELSAARTAGRRVFVVRGRAVGDPAPEMDAAGEAALDQIKRQGKWATWDTNSLVQQASAYLDQLPTRRVWERDGEAISEVVAAPNAARP